MRYLPFTAIILTALSLIAPGAHLFELPNKIGMSQDQYFMVQDIYQGWLLVGFALPAAILANGALAVAADGTARWLAFAASILIVASLIIFFAWTQPANAATANWTVRPDNWEHHRRVWEYSHAVNAALIFAALCCSTVAALRAASDMVRQ
jgi:hypothetical protein